MIYPDNFEGKTGFDRIRQLLSEKCLSRMGNARVEGMRVHFKAEAVKSELSATWEFQQLLRFEDLFPSQH